MSQAGPLYRMTRDFLTAKLSPDYRDGLAMLPAAPTPRAGAAAT